MGPSITVFGTSLPLLTIFVVAVGGYVVFRALEVLVLGRWRNVEPGHALVVTGANSGTRVLFSGGQFVTPFQKAQTVDTTIKTLTVELLGKDAAVTKDHIRIDVSANFQVKVSQIDTDVAEVLRNVGPEVADVASSVKRLFYAHFVDAIRVSARTLTFQEIAQDRMALREQVVGFVGRDLFGFHLEDLAFTRLEKASSQRA